MNRATVRRPVSVLVIVYTIRGEVLLLHRSKPFDFWQSVTGCLAEGEKHADAAVRELREETGLSEQGLLSFSGTSRSFVIDPRWRRKYPPGVTENLEYEWRYRLQEAVVICLHASEHSEYCWCPIREAVDRVWSWTNRQALQDLERELGA